MPSTAAPDPVADAHMYARCPKQMLAVNLTTTWVCPKEFLIPRGANVTLPRTTPSNDVKQGINGCRGRQKETPFVHRYNSSLESGSTTVARDRNKSQRGHLQILEQHCGSASLKTKTPLASLTRRNEAIANVVSAAPPNNDGEKNVLRVTRTWVCPGKCCCVVHGSH